MKVNFVLKILLGLLLLCQHCLAQTGYNYVRPDVSIGGGNTVNIPATATGSPIGTLGSGGFPTASSVAGNFPTAGATYGTTGNVAPNTAYGGFVQRPAGTAAGFTPTASAGIPASASAYGPTANVPVNQQKRPTLPQRTAGGSIYNAAANIGGQYSQTGLSRVGSTTGTGLESEYGGDYSAIPGIPGVNYPIYSQVPPTSFDCNQQALPGYYSDVEAQCQVFHICALNRTYSFLCPNGTVFSQETLVCVWWNQYDCVSAPSLYANNAYIYDYSKQGPATNAGYQNTNTQPLSIGVQSAGQRQPGNFGAAATPRTTPSNAGIYGASNLRPTPTGSGNYGNLAPSGFQGGGSSTRFGATPAVGQAETAAPQQQFPTPAPFGAVIPRGSDIGSSATNRVGGGGAGGFGGLPNSAVYSNPQVTPSSTNREYLPPRRP